MVLCLMLLIGVSFLQLPVRGRPYHPGLYMRNFKTWKRGTKPLSSLQQGSSENLKRDSADSNNWLNCYYLQEHEA